MSPFRTRLFQLLNPEPARHLPARDDDFATWLKSRRDDHLDDYRSPPPEWHTLDALLDLYRLHADTGTPLDQPVSEGGDTSPHPF